MSEIELLILDKDFREIDILDTYDSLIWTDRYSKCGDFEIYTTVDESLLNVLKNDYYLWTKQSEKVMIIGNVEIESDAENGSKLTVSGYSLENILNRRILLSDVYLTGNFQNSVKKLLNENFISPSNSDRQISNFIFCESSDSYIQSLTFDSAYDRGTSIYDVISSMCQYKNIGFKITLSEDNQFIFELYNGTDRSYDQDVFPYVVFSPNFDNLANSNYVENSLDYKNSIFVIGEEDTQGNERTVTINTEDAIGLERREYYVNASDIQQTSDNAKISDAEYLKKLEERGYEELTNNDILESFEGEVDASNMFVYGENFFMGDIVQLKNEYGIESKSRITEFIISQDSSGMRAYPTFETVGNNEE